MVFLDFFETWEYHFLSLEVTSVHSSANRVATFCFEGRSSWLVLHRDTSQATHNTGKPKQDILFKKLDFEGIGVNQRSS